MKWNETGWKLKGPDIHIEDKNSISYKMPEDQSYMEDQLRKVSIF